MRWPLEFWICFLDSNDLRRFARHVARVLNFASFLSGSSVADEALRKAPKNTLQRKDKAVPCLKGFAIKACGSHNYRSKPDRNIMILKNWQHL